MFAGVKPQRPELKVLVWREHKSVPHSHDKAPWPVGCHQTIKANIRFHLYGGPQGWNPHSFGPERSPRWAINPSDFARPETTFAFPPTPRYYLRASNRARESGNRAPERDRGNASVGRRDPDDLIVVRITSYCPLLLKSIEPRSKERRSKPGSGRRKHTSVTRETRVTSSSFAFFRSARYHLRASNQTRRRRGVRRGGVEASISGVGCTEPPHVVRISSECRVT